MEKRIHGLEANVKDSLWEMKNLISQEFNELQKRQGEGRKKDDELLRKEI